MQLHDAMEEKNRYITEQKAQYDLLAQSVEEYNN